MKKFQIAVIAVPDVAFFPSTTLPLYVVEPQYCQMIKELVEKDLPLAVAMADHAEGDVSNSRRSYFSPHRVATMGTPYIADELPDGTLKVFVRGICRVELVQLIQNLPFLVYEAEVLPDLHEEGLMEQGTIARLKTILDSWVEEVIDDSVERTTFLSNVQTAFHVADYLAMFMVQDPRTKQLILETKTLSERIRFLNMLFRGECPRHEDFLISEALKDYGEIEKLSEVAH